MFCPDPDHPPTGADGKKFVSAVGAANGHLGSAECLLDANAQGCSVAIGLGWQANEIPAANGSDLLEAPLLPVWLMPQGANYDLRSKSWLDFQNDVKVNDVQLAAQEGFESVEHAKRYTTLGMATDQGKLSNINGLAILSNALNVNIQEVGTTTFRPPYTPISMASLAGEARGELFQPIRKTSMHEWHERHGANWEPVAGWRRPFAYLQTGETIDQAVNREVLNTRENLGILDA